VAMLPVDREANDSSVEAVQGGEVWTNEARLVAGLATRRRWLSMASPRGFG
jgi:hypothetical protein